MADAVEPVRFVADLLEWLDSYPKLIQYNPAGGIIIPDPEKFCSTILSKREGSSNFTSFVRQLNYHGFSKSKTPGSQRGIFTHSHFVRGRLDLIATIRRKNGNDPQQRPEAENLKALLQESHAHNDALKQALTDLHSAYQAAVHAVEASGIRLPAAALLPASVQEALSLATGGNSSSHSAQASQRKRARFGSASDAEEDDDEEEDGGAAFSSASAALSAAAAADDDSAGEGGSGAGAGSETEGSAGGNAGADIIVVHKQESQSPSSSSSSTAALAAAAAAAAEAALAALSAPRPPSSAGVSGEASHSYSNAAGISSAEDDDVAMHPVPSASSATASRAGTPAVSAAAGRVSTGPITGSPAVPAAPSSSRMGASASASSAVCSPLMLHSSPPAGLGAPVPQLRLDDAFGAAAATTAQPPAVSGLQAEALLHAAATGDISGASPSPSPSNAASSSSIATVYQKNNGSVTITLPPSLARRLPSLATIDGAMLQKMVQVAREMKIPIPPPPALKMVAGGRHRGRETAAASAASSAAAAAGGGSAVVRARRRGGAATAAVAAVATRSGNRSHHHHQQQQQQLQTTTLAEAELGQAAAGTDDDASGDVSMGVRHATRRSKASAARWAGMTSPSPAISSAATSSTAEGVSGQNSSSNSGNKGGLIEELLEEGETPAAVLSAAAANTAIPSLPHDLFTELFMATDLQGQLRLSDALPSASASVVAPEGGAVAANTLSSSLGAPFYNPFLRSSGQTIGRDVSVSDSNSGSLGDGPLSPLARAAVAAANGSTVADNTSGSRSFGLGGSLPGLGLRAQHSFSSSFIGPASPDATQPLAGGFPGAGIATNSGVNRVHSFDILMSAAGGGGASASLTSGSASPATTARSSLSASVPMVLDTNSLASSNSSSSRSGSLPPLPSPLMTLTGLQRQGTADVGSAFGGFARRTSSVVSQSSSVGNGSDVPQLIPVPSQQKQPVAGVDEDDNSDNDAPPPPPPPLERAPQNPAHASLPHYMLPPSRPALRGHVSGSSVLAPPRRPAFHLTVAAVGQQQQQQQDVPHLSVQVPQQALVTAPATQDAAMTSAASISQSSFGSSSEAASSFAHVNGGGDNSTASRTNEPPPVPIVSDAGLPVSREEVSRWQRIAGHLSPQPREQGHAAVASEQQEAFAALLARLRGSSNGSGSGDGGGATGGGSGSNPTTPLAASAAVWRVYNDVIARQPALQQLLRLAESTVGPAVNPGLPLVFSADDRAALQRFIATAQPAVALAVLLPVPWIRASLLQLGFSCSAASLQQLAAAQSVLATAAAAVSVTMGAAAAAAVGTATTTTSAGGAEGEGDHQMTSALAPSFHHVLMTPQQLQAPSGSGSSDHPSSASSSSAQYSGPRVDVVQA